MRKGITGTGKPSMVTHEASEERLRLKVQECMQEILVDEVEEFWGGSNPNESSL